MAKKQTKPAQADIWGQVLQQSKEVQTFPPKLELGGKTDTGSCTVTFLEDVPRTFEYKNRFAGGALTTGLAIKCQVKESTFGNQAGETCELILEPTKRLALLIAKVADEQGGLEGVTVRISSYLYEHEQYGETKGFNVDAVSNDNEPAP